MQERAPDPKVKTFLDNLITLDAGGKARLKRDAGKSLEEAQSLGLFYRLLPYGISKAQEESFFLAATLFPLAEGGGKSNMGSSLRRVRDTKNHKGLDRRIEILLDADMAQLPFRLRQAVKLCKSKNVHINWQRLLEDLLQWSHPKRFIQKQWAREYFALSDSNSQIQHQEILPKNGDEDTHTNF